ncbi:MAG: GNAT family N-acetyltransferase [Alphaproteobacteria bacterium]|nr:GNAT family N-acetyltransferase [Alphaproteobacteria bacterium]
MGVVIREARPEDAAGIAELANALSLHEGVEPGFTEEKVLRDGFGAHPAFSALVADDDGELCGYALITDFYDTDRAGRSLWMLDLFVRLDWRRRGVARRLFAAVAAEAVRRNAVSLWFGVLSSNSQARTFYEAFSPKDDDARILELERATLLTLAAETEHLPTNNR